MTVKEIIEQELRNKNAIYLLKEGMFFRSYNRSAMLMVTTLFPYKVHKKWIKKVNEYIYYCGFPEQGLTKVKKKALEKGYSISNEGEKMLVITGVMVKESYENWQKQVEGVESARKVERSEESVIECGRCAFNVRGGNGWGSSSPSAPQNDDVDSSSPLAPQNDEVASVKELEIIQRLRTYQVANHTPMETMQFVTRLQKNLAVMENAGVTGAIGFG